MTEAACHPSHHCTLAVVRALTNPLLFPPPTHNDELKNAMMSPWNVRVPVDPTDYPTRNHWQGQKHTELFNAMFDWEPSTTTVTASLHPYFSFGSPGSPFFAPWEDVGNCLKHLLLHRIASHQTDKSIVLTSHDVDLFIATAPNFQESELERLRTNVQARVNPGYYLLRCHHDKLHNQLIFGYHSPPALAEQFHAFHKLQEISLLDDDWRLTTCIVLKNLARIMHCLQDYAVPLVWSSSRKLNVVRLDNGVSYIQKIYETENICNIFNSTVTNMIYIYRTIEHAKVPHTDRLVSVVENKDGERICRFAPVGRSYLPHNLKELLDALICVSEALAVMHSIGIMHRDIRWANVFRSFSHSDNQHSLIESELTSSHEWVLFDFEFAASAPQSAFEAHTLTPGNHAPEMVNSDHEVRHSEHGLPVDIWGLGYLLQHASVDVPASHASDLRKLQHDCLQKYPIDRPAATQCLKVLRTLKERPSSTEKDISEYLRM